MDGEAKRGHRERTETEAESLPQCMGHRGREVSEYRDTQEANGLS